MGLYNRKVQLNVLSLVLEPAYCRGVFAVKAEPVIAGLRLLLRL